MTRRASSATNAYVSGDGVAHALHPRQGRRGQLLRLARRDDPHRLRQADRHDRRSRRRSRNGRKITLTGTDALSGPSGSVEWQLDNGAVKTASQATITGAGPHVLKTRVQDNAGNWSDWKSANVTVDPNLPSEDSDAPIDNTTIPTNWRTGPVTVTVTADDNGGTGVRLRRVPHRRPARSSPAPNGSTFAVDRRRRARDRDPRDRPRRQRRRLAHAHAEDRPDAARGHLRRCRPAGSTSRDIALTATDATSGVAKIEYTVNGGSRRDGQRRPRGLHAPGRRHVHGRAPRHRRRRAADRLEDAARSRSTPSSRSTRAPPRRRLADDGAVAEPHRHRRRLGRRSRRVARRTPATVQTGTPAVVATDGTQTLRDARRRQGRQRVGVARRDRQGRPHQADQHDPGRQPRPGARRTSRRRSPAPTRRPACCASSGSSTTRRRRRRRPAVSIAGEGSYKLYTRVLDNAGNASDWRVDTVGDRQDRSDARRRLRRRRPGATRPATCTVSAVGGLSGLPTLTGARGGDGPVDVSGGVYTVDAEGSSTIDVPRRRRRRQRGHGAGRGQGRPHRPGRHGRPARRTPKSLNYTCTAGGTDGAVRPDRARPGRSTAVPRRRSPPARTFTVAKGKVVVTGADAAGNVGASAPVTLAARKRAPTSRARGPTVTPRSTSEAVLLKGKASASARLVGQLALSSTPVRDDGRPAPARARQGHVPARASRSPSARRPRPSPRPRRRSRATRSASRSRPPRAPTPRSR